MWTAIGLMLGFACLLLAVISLSRKCGETAAQASMRKYELNRLTKEQARANKIIDSVRNMSPDTVRKRLQDRKRK